MTTFTCEFRPGHGIPADVIADLLKSETSVRFLAWRDNTDVPFADKVSDAIDAFWDQFGLGPTMVYVPPEQGCELGFVTIATDECVPQHQIWLTYQEATP